MLVKNKILLLCQTLFIFFTAVMAEGLIYADVLPIQTLKTKQGIEVWLIEDHTSPIVSLSLSFEKPFLSSPYTPNASLFTQAINSGAGILTPLEMEHFSNETPARWGLQTGISKNYLLLKTTKGGLKPTLELWARLIKDPQFEKTDFQFLKSKALAGFIQDEENLGFLANMKLLETIFPKASFDIDFDKAKKELFALSPQDLKQQIASNFLYTRPKVVVVGDTTKMEITELLDSTFGTLKLNSFSETPPFTPVWQQTEIFIHKDIPQSIITFAQPGINPTHKDYPKFLLLQNILSVRFYDELRTKRGYIYSISFDESHYKKVDVLRGTFSCECKQTQRVLRFVRSEWERLKDFGITQAELTLAKRALKQSKILNLTSTEAVASEYAEALDYNLGPDSANALLADTEKVNLDEMNEFVHDVLKPSKLIFVLLSRDSK